MKTIVLLLTAFILVLCSCSYKKGEVAVIDTTPVDSCTINITYQNHISGIMNTYCTFSGCHDAGSAGGTGDFTSYAEIDVKKIIIKDRINRAEGEAGKMPLAGTTGPPVLTSCDLAKLNAWLDAGAPNN